MSRPSLPSKQKYVTRACDACKKRKSKCDGLEPCARCLNSEIECTYNSSYNRVQKHNALRQRQRMRPESELQDASTQAEALNTSTARPPDSREDSSNGKDDDDTGDASVHAFLRRVSGHLAQIGQGLPRNLFKQEKDTPRNGDSARSFLLPDKQVAQSYVECYYEHANVTYRYVPQGHVSELLSSAYAEDELVLQDDTRMALLLTVMGMGCIWTASWKNQPLPPWRAKAQKFLLAADQRLERAQGTFPPTLNLLQALVLKSQLELASSRYNSAWVTLGLAVRLGQMIDIQREPASGGTTDAHYRRCTFWAMFMIDRYLAVSLGRPMAIHESDITVSYPTELHPRVAVKLGAYEKKLLVGVVAHVKLTQIIGHVITRLYRGTKYPPISEEQIIIELETELRQWLHDTPEFFHPKSSQAPLPTEDSFYDVPWIFRRQQKTIQASYHFANMLIYRGSLLQEFLHQAPSTPRVGPSSEQVKACVDNALAMAVLAADFGAEECKYNATFWTTSHFIFCAISILLVYLTLYRETVDHTIIESAVEEAMKVHRKLDYSDNIRTQKLLEESRSRTENVRNMASPASSSAVNRTQTHNVSRPDQPLEGSDNRDLASYQPRVEVIPVSTVCQLQQQPQEQYQDETGPDMFGNMMMERNLETFGTVDDLGMIMDIGFDNAAFSEAFGGDQELHF